MSEKQKETTQEYRKRYNEIFKKKSEPSEPSEQAIKEYMNKHNENYYNSRERLREKEYGGKPPCEFQSWGDYWKQY